MKILLKYKLALAGIIAGAVGGYLYYRFVGCANGTCAITSDPLISTLYGSVMGGLFFDVFRKKNNSES